jgi:hypothetical protein
VVDPDALRRRLLLGVAIVAMLGLAIELIHLRMHDELVEVLLEKLSLSYEGNLPTWWSSALLLGNAVAAGAIATRRPPQALHWWGIAAVAGWMSLDETAELHEHLGGLFGTGGVLYYDWVIPAAVVLVALALVFVPFMRALAPATRMRLVIAAAIYVSGALVMELPLGWWTEHHGSDGLGYALIDWLEETLEMVGASLALVALVRHRAEHTEATA